jgi:hypothetical protein
MAGFIARILNLVLPGLLSWIGERLAQAYESWDARRRERDAIREKNERIRKETEAAQTTQERDRAAEDLRSNFPGA